MRFYLISLAICPWCSGSRGMLLSSFSCFKVKSLKTNITKVSKTDTFKPSDSWRWQTSSYWRLTWKSGNCGILFL